MTMDNIDKQIKLSRLHQDFQGCQKCDLHKHTRHKVCWAGSFEAKLMIIGEAATAADDRDKDLLVGRSGKLFFEIMGERGFKKEHFFITNVLKCWPTDDGQTDRDPRSEEARTCGKLLAEQVILRSPKVIITLGGLATETLLGLKGGITRLRGHVYEFQGIPVVPMFHPSYIDRMGGHHSKQKPQMLEDIQTLLKTIKGLAKQKAIV